MLWPNGKTFAFTVFDDPDAQTLSGCRTVYDFLGNLGFRTTIGVWPCAPIREPNSPGETCANPEYRGYVQQLSRAGFEVGYHNTTPHSSTRPEISTGLQAFSDYFGSGPSAMANHYNAEAIYWGRSRLSGLAKHVYRIAALRNKTEYFWGHVPDSQYFWGDYCKEKIRYCRNFVFGDINTLRECPSMPYYDADRPYVNAWFASSEGANVSSFVETISEANQDRLEAQGGACIMYAHFGHGFSEKGKLDRRFQALMERMSKKNGWFVPVSTLLDYVRQGRPEENIISSRQRAALEWRWLSRKLTKGTS